MIKKEDIRAGAVISFVNSIQEKIILGYNFHGSLDGSINYFTKGEESCQFVIKEINVDRGEVIIEPTIEIFDDDSLKERIFSFKIGIKSVLMFGFLEEKKVSIEGNVQLNADTKSFMGIVKKMTDTYTKKNHDYGNAFSEMYDELGFDYGYGKIREKVNRIKTLKDGDAMVENEPLEDALLDCANYCILTLMEYQKRKGHGKE